MSFRYRIVFFAPPWYKEAWGMNIREWPDVFCKVFNTAVRRLKADRRALRRTAREH